MSPRPLSARTLAPRRRALPGWRRRAAILLAGILALAAINAPAAAASVGFVERVAPDGARPALKVGVWYPTDAAPAPTPLGLFSQSVAPGAAPSGRRLPLIVMSHGTGGWYGEHYDTALALAQAGFVVAALSHPGDTFEDNSRAVDIIDRPRQLKVMTDFILSDAAFKDLIDPRRIGVFGFSAGGFTALAAIGAVADFSKIPDHVLAHPDYFDSGVVRRAGGVTPAQIAAGPRDFSYDPRLRAAVVAAPALGFAFGVDGLKRVSVPVQLWRAENDHILPHPLYAEAVRIALPRPPEAHLVAGADHFDFLAPCTARLAAVAAEICRPTPGFDRAAFHADFNREVVRFFQESLR